MPSENSHSKMYCARYMDGWFDTDTLHRQKNKSKQLAVAKYEYTWQRLSTAGWRVIEVEIVPKTSAVGR